MTTPHPQADLLHAIADGKQMQGRVPEDGCDWFDIYPDQAIGAIASDYSMKIRIKPGTVTINGIECPAPMRVAPAAQPLTQDEKENQLCMSSASCGQASTNESAFITSTQRSDGTFSASSEKQSYRDSDGMPTERAVLEREWRRMKIALSAPAAQPPAGWPRASISDSRLGWTLDYKFLEKVEQLAKSRTEYSTSMEATEQVLIAALEVLAAAPKAEPVPAVEREELRDGASYESMNLAAMVLSDCGHSSNYEPLLERVAGRIDRHVERLLAAQREDLTTRAQAAPASHERDEAINILARFAEGLTTHKYSGDCPSNESPKSRDPQCVVCWAIDAARAKQEASNA